MQQFNILTIRINDIRNNEICYKCEYTITAHKNIQENFYIMKYTTSPCPKCNTPIKIKKGSTKAACSKCDTILIIDDDMFVDDEKDDTSVSDSASTSIHKETAIRSKTVNSSPVNSDANQDTPSKPKVSCKKKSPKTTLLYFALASISILILLLIMLLGSNKSFNSTPPANTEEIEDFMIDINKNSTIEEYEKD